MSKIKQLDAHTANMIAAGEVVERPMGVVKELVENAIDAGSTRIVVSIEEGGIKKLTVSDNGCGMDSMDAQLCFERHATSKIRNENDLWSIHTLGFRGEALPSIGSVARVTVNTSDGEDSTQVIVAYGKKESVCPYPCSQGTEISVEGLFYQTPARLKHMRSASYEASLIQDVIHRFALSHPDISFRFINDGRDGFRSSGQGDLLEVMYSVYGRSAVECAVPCSFEDFDYRVNGYLIGPSVTRAGRNLMHIFLNGRMVRTYRLYKAVQDGYQGLIPDGRYPLCVLNIEMDPHLLDVNVHPSKWEVRISKENQLEVLLKDGVRKALHQEDVIPEKKPEPITYYQPISFDTDDLENAQEPSVNLGKSFTLENRKAILKEAQEDARILQEIHEKTEERTVHEEPEEKIPFPSMRIIGQYRSRFILGETQRGLAVVDGHQARRRIAYERILKQIGSTGVKTELLVPMTFHVSDDLVRRVQEINDGLQDIGIVFEPFGDNTLLVRTIPVWMKDIEPEQILQDVLDLFAKDSLKDALAVARHQAALSASARLSEKDDHLMMSEMETLIAELKECDNPFTAVDGSTLIMIMEDARLLKGFSL
ncbi:MAG: DNA mismatch repair endonuclease MutL [Bulleidia sp.]